MNTLEKAQSKLERLQAEQESNHQAIREEIDRIPFGQPNMVGKPNIYKGLQRKYAKQHRLYEEVEKQENRIEMLETVEEFKKDHELIKDVHVVGKTSEATIGARTSVNNLDYFKNKLVELEKQNEEAKAYNKTKPARKRKTLGAEITKLKNKIAYLEQMEGQDKNKTVSEHTQELIDSGAVTQWQKKPIYYFVKGLKKVALEIDEKGDFYVSGCYPTNTEEDEKKVAELLQA